MGSIISLAISVGCAYWVYTDSKKNNMENGTLWTVLAFFFSIIGVAVYWWKRSQHLKAVGGGGPGQGQLPG